MSDPSEPVSSIQSLQLHLPPSCLEFCSTHPSYFLVGTYNLQKDEEAAVVHDDADEDKDEQESTQPASAKAQSRNGSIITFQLVNERIAHVQTIPQPSAILDLRFNPKVGKQDICAAVSSTSTLAVFKLSPGENEPLKHAKTMDMSTMSKGMAGPVPGVEVLFLAFCWHPSRAGTVAITTSTGHVHLVDLGDIDGSWELYPDPVITHSLEAWCVAISPCLDPAVPSHEDAFTMFSGGDDSILRCQTCIYKDDELDLSLPPSKLRGHDAGVTAILPIHLKRGRPCLVVTGSYDDHIRLFSLVSPSIYSPCRAENLAESNLGGGVWRLKLIDTDEADDTVARGYRWRARILASCMHAGVRIVELLETSDGQCQFRTISRFEGHRSMNYGSDFWPGSTERKLSVVSTSFYDKLLCFWEVDLQGGKAA
ncbi:hypothetical protein B0H66DRAFT_553350 [Apodospora peruviana]|uniref:Uncharacterized protein n=1 Tax=Apodospora peruviana TaxID=516989 RepID=A0AAE0M8Q4_9PEZI|nr:hypothetical protein B0H66DRAFT_553350 [Apodospora peruviana]